VSGVWDGRYHGLHLFEEFGIAEIMVNTLVSGVWNGRDHGLHVFEEFGMGRDHGLYTCTHSFGWGRSWLTHLCVEFEVFVVMSNTPVCGVWDV